MRRCDGALSWNDGGLSHCKRVAPLGSGRPEDAFPCRAARATPRHALAPAFPGALEAHRCRGPLQGEHLGISRHGRGLARAPRRPARGGLRAAARGASLPSSGASAPGACSARSGRRGSLRGSSSSASHPSTRFIASRTGSAPATACCGPSSSRHPAGRSSSSPRSRTCRHSWSPGRGGRLPPRP